MNFCKNDLKEACCCFMTAPVRLHRVSLYYLNVLVNPLLYSYTSSNTSNQSCLSLSTAWISVAACASWSQSRCAPDASAHWSTLQPASLRLDFFPPHIIAGAGLGRSRQHPVHHLPRNAENKKRRRRRIGDLSSCFWNHSCTIWMPEANVVFFVRLNYFWHSVANVTVIIQLDCHNCCMPSTE